MILSKLLRQEGYDTDYALTGKDALLLLENQHYDFLIVDYKLPDTSGFEILKRFDYNYHKTNAIMISAYINEDVRTRAEKYNTLIFDKPVDNYDLLSAIDSLI